MEQPSTIPAPLLPLQDAKAEQANLKPEGVVPKIVFWCVLGAIVLLAVRYLTH